MEFNYDDMNKTVYGTDLLPVMLSEDNIDRVIKAFCYAHEHGHYVRVAIDSEGFKVKIGERTWSPPMGMHE